MDDVAPDPLVGVLLGAPLAGMGAGLIAVMALVMPWAMFLDHEPDPFRDNGYRVDEIAAAIVFTLAGLTWWYLIVREEWDRYCGRPWYYRASWYRGDSTRPTTGGESPEA